MQAPQADINAANADDQHDWDTGYEYRVVGLMALGFGLVGLDRYIINPLFPVIAEDLGLNYQDLGLISAVLALTWGLSSIFAGNLTDRIGHRKVLVGSTVAFSALVAFTGVATGLASLMLIRGLMGLAEGGFVPASITQTVKASSPKRIGLNFGLMQMSAPLCGLFLGPIIAISLLEILPSWEWVFGVVAIPGFIAAYMMSRTLRDPEPPVAAPDTPEKPEPAVAAPSLLAPLKYRNILFGCLALIAFLMTLSIGSTFMPNFLTDYVGLPLGQMGLVMAFLGMGGLAGMIVLPGLSDVFGRKPVISIAVVIEAFAIIGLITVGPGTSIFLIALCLFVFSAMTSGAVSILVGPVISLTVPPSIAATATGVVVGLGEIFGGAGGPAVAGFFADQFGIDIVPRLMMGGAAVALITVVFGLKEPQRLDSTNPDMSPAG